MKSDLVFPGGTRFASVPKKPHQGLGTATDFSKLDRLPSLTTADAKCGRRNAQMPPETFLKYQIIGGCIFTPTFSFGLDLLGYGIVPKWFSGFATSVADDDG